MSFAEGSPTPGEQSASQPNEGPSRQARLAKFGRSALYFVAHGCRDFGLALAGVPPTPNTISPIAQDWDTALAALTAHQYPPPPLEQQS